MEKIAILIPCYNEELTIQKVIADFKKELPNATIYVYDNNSIDQTYHLAKTCNTNVKREPRQGKGNVIKSMFQDIDADIYVLIDGDDTYPVSMVYKLIEPIMKKEADMVVGDRMSHNYKHINQRNFHNFGNNLVKLLINKLFQTNLQDIMSGYRVFNKKFVKNIPINSEGFEIETEMTLHALDKRFLIKEIPIEYKNRPEGSISKLNTFKDGIRVLSTIIQLFKDYKPLKFFSLIFCVFFISSLLLGIPVVIEFINISFVTKVPSAILAVGLMLIAIGSLFSSFILDTIVRKNREFYNLRLKDWIEKNQKSF